MFTQIPPDAVPDRHSLFFAILPAEPIAAQIKNEAEQLRRTERLAGKTLAHKRLHISLCHLGDYYGALDAQVVTAAAKTAERLSASPVEITLDRLLSFQRGSGKSPLVLCGGEGLSRLRAFRQNLAIALVRAGFRIRGGSSFTPHMTLLYDDRVVEGRNIRPINWTAWDFTLIDSLVGKTRHVQLGRWPLRE